MAIKKRAHKVSKGTARGAKRRPLTEGAKILLNKGFMDDDSLRKRRQHHQWIADTKGEVTT